MANDPWLTFDRESVEFQCNHAFKKKVSIFVSWVICESEERHILFVKMKGDKAALIWKKIRSVRSTESPSLGTCIFLDYQNWIQCAYLISDP